MDIYLLKQDIQQCKALCNVHTNEPVSGACVCDPTGIDGDSEYKVELMTLYLSIVKSGYMYWRCGLARGQNSCRILVDKQFGKGHLHDE